MGLHYSCCRKFSWCTPGIGISQEYLLRKMNLIGMETLQILAPLAVAVKDKMLGLQLSALFSLFSFAEVGMGFFTALFVQWVCREGAAGSGHICIALCSCCGTPCQPPIKGISQSRFASCAEARAALCVSSSGIRWNPSHHFWSYLQMPLCLCWAWIKPRWSIPCSILETSLSPILLLLFISLMFCLWTDLYHS